MIALIQRGMKENEEFRTKMQYWVHERNKQPDVEWLFNELCKIFDVELVKQTFDKYKQTN